MNDTIKKEVFTPEKPDPLFKPIQEAERYPIDALGEFADVVFAMHDITQAPIPLSAQSLLATASLCTQHIANVETLSGGDCPLSLFLLSLGKSGERKSSNDKLLMKFIDDLQHELEQNRKAKLKKHEMELALWNSQHKQIMNGFAYKGKNANKTKSKTEVAADLEALGEPPREPLEHLITFSDPTIEGIFDLLDNGRPSVALMTDEGGKIFGGHGMNKDNRLKSIASYSSFWDGTPANQVRRTSKTKTLYGKRLCMHILVQPEIAQDIFSDGMSLAQGFLARMLMTYPDSTIGYRPFREPDPHSLEIIEQIGHKIKAYLNQLSHIEADNNELSLPTIKLSPEAKVILSEFHNEIEMAQRQGGKYYDIIPYASKACEQVCRIAGVLTLFTDCHARQISCETIKNAIKLIRFYLGEALRMTGTVLIPPELQKAETLRKWLIDEYGGDYINPRTIMQRAKGNLKTKAQAMQAIRILEEHKWLVRCTEPQMIDGHRSSKEAYKINRG